MIVVDTSGVFSALDRSQPHHAAARDVLEGEGPFVLSPFVLAELDYLLATRISTNAGIALLRDVEAGAYELATFGPEDVGRAAEVVEQYADLELGVADASIVVLADRYETDRILTLDHRHFRALATLRGEAFEILPAV